MNTKHLYDLEERMDDFIDSHFIELFPESKNNFDRYEHLAQRISSLMAEAALNILKASLITLNDEDLWKT